MANGNGNGNGVTPAWKVIAIPITVCIGMMTIALSMQNERLKEHENEISQLRKDLYAKTDQRYRIQDAIRDFALTNERMNRIEVSDAECARRINEHITRHP